MNFDQLKDDRQRFGLEDPLRAISTEPGTEGNRWELKRFFQVGRDTVAAFFEDQEYQARYLGGFFQLLRPAGLCPFQLSDHLSNTVPPGPDGAPVMETYGMAPGSVAEIVARHGGVALRTEENGWAGSSARSFNYLVAKR